jgi:hypothetical protein
MSRTKGSKNKNHTYITYPRACTTCGHLSNNPGSFSMHKKIHDPIPPNQLCDLGCEQLAKFKGMHGKFRFTEEANLCPAVSKRISDAVTQHWVDDDGTRLDNTKDTFMKVCCGNTKAIEKGKQTKRTRMIAQDNTADRRKYNRQVHNLSRVTYLEKKDTTNNLKIGRFDNHLDHKVSKHVGFLLSIPAEYLASEFNLEVIPFSENISKGGCCSLHPLELLTLCGAPKLVLDQIQLKLAQLSSSFEQLMSSHKQRHVPA